MRPRQPGQRNGNVSSGRRSHSGRVRVQHEVKGAEVKEGERREESVRQARPREAGEAFNDHRRYEDFSRRRAGFRGTIPGEQRGLTVSYIPDAIFKQYPSLSTSPGIPPVRKRILEPAIEPFVVTVIPG
jgi:hypothetical protein